MGRYQRGKRPRARTREPGCLSRRKPISNDTPNPKEGIDTRTRKALEEPLSVVDLDGTPVEDTDGGRLQRAASERERTRVPVAGGVLVFERRDVGKELVGFESVSDWDGVRTALSARGIGVGAIHHLPVFNK